MIESTRFRSEHVSCSKWCGTAIDRLTAGQRNCWDVYEAF